MLMAYTGIRRFGEQDVAEVADLHRRVMRSNAAAAAGWVAQYGNGKVAARMPGQGKLKAIEDAPGAYARMRVDRKA